MDNLMSPVKCGCPIMINHYGCSCKCRLCRKGTNKDDSDKNRKNNYYYRYHFICFECRIGKKSDYMPVVSPTADPDDKNFTSKKVETLPSIFVNNYSDIIKCSKCHNPIFVAGYDTKIPKQKNIKEWKILQEVLVNFDIHFDKMKEIYKLSCKPYMKCNVYYKNNLFNYCHYSGYNEKRVGWFPKRIQDIEQYLYDFYLI